MVQTKHSQNLWLLTHTHVGVSQTCAFTITQLDALYCDDRLVGNILVQPIEEEAQVCHKSINGSVVVAVIGGVGVEGWVQV